MSCSDCWAGAMGASRRSCRMMAGSMALRSCPGSRRCIPSAWLAFPSTSGGGGAALLHARRYPSEESGNPGAFCICSIRTAFENPASRRPQIEVLLNGIRRIPADEAFVLTGDFNTETYSNCNRC